MKNGYYERRANEEIASHSESSSQAKKKKFRNHNDNGSVHQDPAVWESVTNATIQANLFRYSYLSYLYR